MKKQNRLFFGNVVLWIGMFLFGCIVTAYGKADPVSNHSPGEEKETFWMQKKKNSEKVAYLTFDDGPSNHSEQLLDLLEEEGVKAMSLS